MDNKVTFKIYLENNNIDEPEFYKEYLFELNIKIIDIKNIIYNDLKNDKKIEETFNTINLSNITDRIYKDFGKLSFNLGLIPNTIDNYKLFEFTNDKRVYSFIAIPFITVIKTINKVSGVLKKVIMNENKNDFCYDPNDFPVLK
jgi:hypothetical protein